MDAAQVIHDSSKTYDELYETIGQFVSNPNDLSLNFTGSLTEETFIKSRKIWKEQAIEFLKKYWENISKAACAWWKDNKDKFDQFGIVTKLFDVIIAVIPAPYNFLGGLVKGIISLLLKSGLNTVCEHISPNPPES